MKMNLTDFLIVFLGSGLGGVCRYGLSHVIQTNAGAAAFPWGTFAVNMAGCLLIGLIYGFAEKSDLLSPELRLLATVGFCGGFTTFSTFVNENYLLLGMSEGIVAIAYALASLAVRLGCVYAGHLLVR